MPDGVIAPVVQRYVGKRKVRGLNIRRAPRVSGGIFDADSHLEVFAVGACGGGNGDAQIVRCAFRGQHRRIRALVDAGRVRLARQLDDLVGVGGRAFGGRPRNRDVLPLVGDFRGGDARLRMGGLAQPRRFCQIDPAPGVEIFGIPVIAGYFRHGQALPRGDGGK